MDTACVWVAHGSGASIVDGSRVMLSDGDLLAPVLLNVPVNIHSFYGLQRVRGQLEEALAHPDLAVPLASITDPERVRAMVAPLYAVLDGHDRPWRVRATTLSKVLHRKRPHSVVLHDKWVRACYVGDGCPVPSADRRTWTEYMGDITVAIGSDLRTQPKAFDVIEAAMHPPAALSRVRLLDILAWKSQGTRRPQYSEDPAVVSAPALEPANAHSPSDRRQ